MELLVTSAKLPSERKKASFYLPLSFLVLITAGRQRGGMQPLDLGSLHFHVFMSLIYFIVNTDFATWK